ncbi:MAG: DNA repair protein RecO [Roseiflexaceae bacterium]
MRDRVYRAEALIIRRSSFGESDRLLTIYTPQGKRRVVAKGARKTISRLAGHIELFTHTQLMLAVGRSLDIVTQSQEIRDFARLRTDLERIGASYYAAELLDRLTEEGDENPAAFRLVVSAFAGLDSSERIDLVLRWYELHLLDSLGYRPQLTECAICHEVLDETTDRFSPQAGGAICPRCASSDRSALPMGLAAFKLLRLLQAQPLSGIERLSLSQGLRSEAEQLLRAAIRQLLERDLKSVAFLDEVRQG